MEREKERYIVQLIEMCASLTYGYHYYTYTLYTHSNGSTLEPQTKSNRALHNWKKDTELELDDALQL